MAGLQYYCRKPLSCSLRFISKNGLLLQPSRSRHHLVFQISSPQNRMVFQKSQLLINKHKQQLVYRLASTNVNTSKEPVVKTPETSVTKNESVPANSEAGAVEHSKVVIDEGSLPPIPSSDVTEVPMMEFVSTNLKEPSFESLGLISSWPSGLLRQLCEYMHISLDMPWWQVIIGVTIITRILIFPVNVSVRRDVVHMSNHLPEISKLQKKVTDARTSGDYYAVAQATQDLQMFFKEKKINLFSFLKVGLFQGPVFLSVFYAFKGMSRAPVESLKEGGLLWFPDLTVPDPYYLLPLILSTTMLCCIELGAEGASPTASSHAVKWFMRAIPGVVFLVSTRFESCICWYWTISNFIVLCQAGLFKIPAVGRILKIPKAIVHPKSAMSEHKKGFIEGFKEGFANARISGQIEARERMTAEKFQKAGTGSVPRTFKKNPLLQKERK